MATVTRPLHRGAVRPKTADDPAPSAAPQQPNYVPPKPEPLSGAYFWLVVFFIVYCIRPEDWVPGLHVIPLAKISGIFAALALFLSIGRSKRPLQQIPLEIWFTAVLTGWLTVSSLLSPVWRGGAFFKSMDFAKLLVAMVVGFLVVTSLARLRRLLFVQAASVVVIAAISLVTGHSHLRVYGLVGGMYENSNDLAFAIALTVPLCFAFALRSRSIVVKALWGGGSLGMIVTLFLTGSRGGAITLAIATLVCLWHFGIQGKRPQLVLATIVAVVALFVLTGGVVAQRFSAMSGKVNDTFQLSAYESYQQRSLLIDLSLSALKDHPLFGLGTGDFEVYSGLWHEVHLAYLQVAVEGGIPALILYLGIFWCGYQNLRRLSRMTLDRETQLFAWALHGTLIAFLIGALFAPDAYQYFPFFTVMYIAALRATVEEQSQPELVPAARDKQPKAVRLAGWRARAADPGQI
jgi:O-antigen ligase